MEEEVVGGMMMEVMEEVVVMMEVMEEVVMMMEVMEVVVVMMMEVMEVVVVGVRVKKEGEEVPDNDPFPLVEWSCVSGTSKTMELIEKSK
jgi:hypothetical protein